mgnify:CR=1 FL=1
MLTTVHFTCSDCAQTIEVNEEMRETILEAGCPVCTAAASDDDFERDPEDGGVGDGDSGSG